MKIVKVVLTIIGCLAVSPLSYATGDIPTRTEIEALFKPLEGIGKSKFGEAVKKLVDNLNDATPQEQGNVWGTFIYQDYLPVVQAKDAQTSLLNRFLHVILVAKGFGPWFIDNVLPTTPADVIKQFKEDAQFALGFAAPAGTQTNNFFLQDAFVNGKTDYQDIWKQSFQQTLSFAPQAIQLDKHSIEAWQKTNILSWVNSQKDSKERNLANLFAFGFLRFDCNQDLLSDLVRDNPGLLLEADQNGRCAILGLAQEWLPKDIGKSFDDTFDEDESGEGSDKSFDYSAYAPWTADLVEQVKATRFGSQRISLGDYLVTCYQGWDTLENGLQAISHPIPKRHPELLTFTTDEFGFGVVDSGKYFANKTDKVGIGPDLWRNIATSKYSLRFSAVPQIFLKVALQTAASKGERYDYESGVEKIIPADSSYDVFWHVKWATTIYRPAVKAQGVQAWESLIDQYTDLGGKLSYRKRGHSIEFEEGTSLGIKALQIVNETYIYDEKRKQEEFITAVIGNGGVFGIDFNRSPNKGEWAVYKDTFERIASDVTAGKDLSDDKELAPIYDNLKEKLFDISYSSTLSPADADQFLDHKRNSFIAVTTNVAESAAVKRALGAAKAANSSFKSDEVRLEDTDFDKIGSYIGLAGSAVKSRYEWIESQWSNDH